MIRILDETDIRQTTGEGEKAVMSQKATTAKFSAAEKRLSNLELAITPSPFITDDAIAYSKVVPENALPYAEITEIGGMTYKDGDTLRSAPVSAVESVGVNLFDFDKWKQTLSKSNANVSIGENSVTIEAIAGDAWAVSNNAKVFVTAGNSYTVYFDKGNTTTVNYLFKNGIVDSSRKIFYNSPYTFVADSDAEFYTVRLGVSATGDTETFSYIRVNEGETALPYTPYFKRTIEIPEAVRPANGINNEVYDYIGFGEQKSVKRVGVVDLGNVNFQYSRDAVVFSGNFPTIAKGLTDNLISDRYVVSFDSVYEMPDLSIRTNESGTGFYIKNTAYTDTATFKAAMSGVMLYYELAAPEITDISDILPADNFIEVEGGGTVTMVNEYGHDVPSSIKYQIKGVTE